MNRDEIAEQLAAFLPEKNIIKDCPMAKRTTFRCGGNAALFITVDSIEELRGAAALLKESGMPWFVLGNGSNVLFTDGGYDGAVLKLGKDFTEIIADGTDLLAGAAVMLPYLSKVAAANHLTGLEFACGIPGSVGGACFMNAGAYDGTIGGCVKNVVALTPEGELLEYEVSELEYAYRHSRFMESGEIVLFARFGLKPGYPSEIQAKMDDLNAKRKAKQPVNYPSAGSFFKRPEGYFAGALIEGAGLKGYRLGGAAVSALHAGFIINEDNATASDVLALCKYVQDTVYEKDGVLLEPEVRIVGEQEETTGSSGVRKE